MSCECPDCVLWKPYSGSVPREELSDESLVGLRPTGLSGDKLICPKDKPVGDPHDQDYAHWLELIESCPNICQNHNDQSPILCHITNAYLDKESVISVKYKYDACQLR